MQRGFPSARRALSPHPATLRVAPSPAAREAKMKAQASPISLRTSLVCSPSRGAGRSEAIGAPSSTIGRADAGAGAAFGGGVLQSSRMPRWMTCGSEKTCCEIVDRARGNAGGFEFVQNFFALHPRRERAELADQFGAMRRAVPCCPCRPELRRAAGRPECRTA